MHEIKSFKIFQTAKVIAVLYLIFGFVEGVILATMVTHRPPQAPYKGTVLILVISVPILAGVLGFIFGVIFCWLYNVVAARIGGVAFELTPRGEN